MDKVTLREQNLHYPWCHVTPCTSYTYPFPFLLTVISFHIFSPPLRKFSLFKQLLKPVFFDSITTLRTLLIAKWTTQLIWISISRNYLQCLQTLINEMEREQQFYWIDIIQVFLNILFLIIIYSLVLKKLTKIIWKYDSNFQSG